MNTYIYRLHFKGPVHFGATGIGLENSLEWLPSDSLTSALINAFSILGGVENAIESLRKEEPAFCLSSLFPFGPAKGNGEMVFGLPRPLIQPRVEDLSIITLLGKELKRIRYLQPSDCASWLNASPFSFSEIKSLIDRNYYLGRELDAERGQGWWAVDLRPRVALDRDSRNSNLWFCGTIRFHPDAGLFGLVDISDGQWKGYLESAFRLLGELGLGGERTYGMGSFDFSGFDPLDSIWPGLPISPEGYRALLSSYYPTDKERSHIRDYFESWDFKESKGYVVSGRMAMTLKRKRLHMITEGSVVKKPVKGKLVDVTPDKHRELGLGHRVYRSGLAFLFPGGEPT